MEKNNKILFIHPAAIVDLQIGSNLKFPPMGLAYLAAVVRDYGYPTMIFDANIEAESQKKLKQILAEFKPTIVGLSFTSVLADSAKQTAVLVKEINPEIKVIAGGYHPTVKPEEVIADPNFDVVFVGEAEISLIEWLRHLEGGADNWQEINGLVFRHQGGVIKTAPRELIPNLDTLPFPAYDLLPIERYSTLSTIRRPYVTFIRSRGCPFQCIFCGVQKMFGRRYRCQSPEKTISDIDLLVKNFGVKEISFRDSDFLINKDNVEKFCQLMIDRHYDLVWTCNARVDMINDKILLLMKKAGCHLVTFGVESGSQEILDQLKKGITVAQIEAAAAAAKKVKMKFTFDIILGGIGETPDSIAETNRLLKKLNPDYVAFNYLTAFPGSELYDEALKSHWFIEGKTNDYSYENLNLNATKMTNQELAQVLRRSLASFYFRPRYILKRLSYLTWPEIKNNFNGLIAILKKLL